MATDDGRLVHAVPTDQKKLCSRLIASNPSLVLNTMTEFLSPMPGQMPPIPDDLTIPEFFFDVKHPSKPERPANVPWLVEDRSGKEYFLPDIRQRVGGLALSLKYRYDIGEDDVVVVFSRNHIDWAILTWATLTLGGIISGANPDYTSGELKYQLDLTKASVLAVHADTLQVGMAAAREAKLPLDRIIVLTDEPPKAPLGYPTIDELVLNGQGMPVGVVTEREFKPGEAKKKIAFLSFSSGTTGRPKAVEISHYAIIANVVQLAVHHRVNEAYTTWEDRRFRPGDSWLQVVPMYHAFGYHICMHFVPFCAMSLVVVPKFSFPEMLKSIQRHKITHLGVVPPMAVLLVKHPLVKESDLSSIHFIMIGAAPLSDEVTQQLYQLFPRAHIGQAYGLTETSTILSMWGVGSKRGPSGSAGQILPGVIAKIITPEGKAVGYDEPGELNVYTPSIALGYHRNKQATEETFYGDGWIRTGDLAKIDKNKEVWILDRLKEIIKVRAFQVAPAELEGCLLDHPDVADACVVGVQDEYSGEVPFAFVVPTTDLQNRLKQGKANEQDAKASIAKHVKDNKVHYKQLAGGVVFVPAIAKTPSGKLLRRVLREQAREMKKAKPLQTKL